MGQKFIEDEARTQYKAQLKSLLQAVNPKPSEVTIKYLKLARMQARKRK